MAKTLYQGNPSFPIEQPQYITTGNSTNDTDIIYCIDTLGQDVTLGSGLLDEDGNASDWASKTVNGVLYGRYKNVAPTDGTLACYRLVPANSES
jgi:hypothetical protein